MTKMIALLLILLSTATTTAAAVNTAAEMIMGFEGFAADAYHDNKQVSIGYGTKANGMKTITREEARLELLREVFERRTFVLKHVKVQLNENELAALISFSYNVGLGSFRKSTLLKKLNAGDRDGATAEFHRWCKSKKKVIWGLRVRRMAEARLFRKPATLRPKMVASR